MDSRGIALDLSGLSSIYQVRIETRSQSGRNLWSWVGNRIRGSNPNFAQLLEIRQFDQNVSNTDYY